MASPNNNKRSKSSNNNSEQQEQKNNDNPFAIHREGDDGIIRRNPFPIIQDIGNELNELAPRRQVHSQQGRYRQEDDYDTENQKDKKRNNINVVTTPFQSNIIDKRTSSDIFYNQHLLSTTALTVARNIDGDGTINSKPLEQYNTSKRNNIPGSSSIFQKTYRYGSKSISRSAFSKEMFGDDKDNMERSNDDADELLSDDENMNYYLIIMKHTLLNLYSYYNNYFDVSSNNTYHQLHQQVLLLSFITMLLYFSSPTLLEPFLSKPPQWSWNINRKLDGRVCAMNYFIEKQAPDEYDPDYKEITDDVKKAKDAAAVADKKKKKTPHVKKKLKPAEIAPGGTYRTKGQVHNIGRFISCVADTFRSNITIHQHLIFANVRDSGHLAEKALIYWPPRGRNKAVLHVIAATKEYVTNTNSTEEGEVEEKGNNNGDVDSDPLQYQYLHEIETRFKGNGQILIYDKHGIAGNVLQDNGEDDDDGAEDDEIREIAKHIQLNHDSKTTTGGNTMMDITSILKPFQEEYEVENVLIPYLHVDGISMEQQIEVLLSAKPLLESRTIVAVGIEHTPDLNVFTLIRFFKNVGYKTFFLGSRQIARIDHLCEEILNDVIAHPSITPPSPNNLRIILNKLGMMDLPIVDWKKLQDETFVQGNKTITIQRNSHSMAQRNVMTRRSYPPFFIALPGDLDHRQSMQIQHMYDLFGGYDSGGGQIKTANDRKAPGKK